MAARAKRAEGLAIASLVLAVVGILVQQAAYFGITYGLGPPAAWCGTVLCLVGVVFGFVAILKKTTARITAGVGEVVGTIGIIAAACLMVSASLPDLSEARELANRVKCGSNLHQIGKGLAMYQGEYEARPENLDLLIKTAYVGPQTLKCPSIHSSRDCDYFYFPPPVNAVSSKTVVLCDYKGNHKNVRHVTYVNGEVAELTESEFQKQLREPYNAKFAATLRAAEKGL